MFSFSPLSDFIRKTHAYFVTYASSVFVCLRFITSFVDDFYTYHKILCAQSNTKVIKFLMCFKFLYIVKYYTKILKCVYFFNLFALKLTI